jgi:hypothetical protein
MTRKRYSSYNVSWTLFVETWQTSKSFREVALKLGIPWETKEDINRARAWMGKRFRTCLDNGVPLKRFDSQRKTRVDWERLAEIAADLNSATD